MSDEKQSSGEQQFRCAVCGFIYDPAIGDPEAGIPPGTPFSELPDSYVCPICGVGKALFDRK